MNVLQVIDKSFLGGGQAVVRTLLAGFRDGPIRVSLSCRDGGPLVRAARVLGATVHAVPFDKLFRPGPARSLAGIVRRERIDLLHAHGLVAATHCTLARSLFGVAVPLVYHQHGFHHRNYGPLTIGLRRAAERAVTRRADRVIAATRSDRVRLLAGRYACPDRTLLIYDAAPPPDPVPADIEEARRSARLDPARPVIGLVGRLHRQKGVDVFLRAAALVLAGVPGAQFVIVGGGSMEPSLRALQVSLRLPEAAVRWAGEVESAPFLPLFTLAVIASRWEGLPIILLDYMALGLPIVTTETDGCLEAVGPREAAIVRCEDPAGMAAAIKDLLRDPPRRRTMGEHARLRYHARFRMEVMLQRIEMLYRDLLGS